MRCCVEKTVYRTQKGWSVILCKALEPVSDPEGQERKKVFCVGNGLPTIQGIEFEAVGEWRQYRGEYQYYVKGYNPLVTENELEVVRFLSRGICTIKTAKDIYRKFGQSSIEVLRSAPQRLLEIKGFTQKKLETILAKFNANSPIERQLRELRQLGVNFRAAEAAIEKYGEETMRIARTMPHKLYIDGIISYDLAEQLAKGQDFMKDDPIRIQAAAIRALTLARAGEAPFRYSGHTCLPEYALCAYTAHILGLKKPGELLKPDKEKIILQTIRGMVKSDRLYGAMSQDAKRFYYLTPLGIAEAGIAAKCLQMLDISENEQNKPALDDIIDKVCVNIRVDLSLEQKKAVCQCLDNRISIVTGGPGTGKTLIQQILVLLARKMYPTLKIALCAPTGVAAQRLAEATGEPASTIHKLLHLKLDDRTHSIEEPQSLLPWDMVIIDEFSMVDEMLFYRLVKRIKQEARLILVGDVDQLPSIGAGSVMQDLIQSGCIPVARLNHNYRQKQGSRIIKNAQLICQGKPELEFDENFQFYAADTFKEAMEKLCSLYLQCTAKVGVENVVVLVPFRENTQTGTEQLNMRLQALINPPAPDKPEYVARDHRVFRLGDRVMQRKNEGAVNNGDMGRILSIDKDSKYPVRVMYSEHREVQYTQADLRKLEISYATTLHRAQGQEYDTVILHLMEAHERMLTRNLFYTGITRAKNHIAIVGQKTAVQRAILTPGEKRNTLLSEWLQGKICFIQNNRLTI